MVVKSRKKKPASAVSRSSRAKPAKSARKRPRQSAAHRRAAVRARAAKLKAKLVARKKLAAQREAQRKAKLRAEREAARKARLRERLQKARLRARLAAQRKLAARREAQRKARRKAAREAARKAKLRAKLRKARLRARLAARRRAKIEARRRAKIRARLRAERRAKRLAAHKARVEARRKRREARSAARRLRRKKQQEARREAKRLARIREKLRAEKRAQKEAERLARWKKRHKWKIKVRPKEPRPPRPPRPPRVLGRALGVLAPMRARHQEIFTPEAREFLFELHRSFEPTRQRLLAERARKQKLYDEGALPDFPQTTRELREQEWKVAPIPADLQDRRVEITGPVDRKMIVNALNSGATHYMADFEDANSPTWSNNIDGQLNLKDYWDGTIDFTDPASGKAYKVGDKPAVLIVRPRGWHLDEAHVGVNREPVSASLFDFGLYFFHNAHKQIAKGTGPYFYLPKLESAEEARLWNDVFVFAQQHLGIPNGTIKATVLIETLPAAFEMDEILWELRDHIAGMNAGRWDYIFSFIKTFAKNPDLVLPDRSQVVMGEAFLGAYAALLVRTCHRRGAFAMGGMAAQIPIKGDQAANDAAFAKVKADKEREVRDGYDGTWVAHPDLVPVAKEVFDRMMPEPNQTDRVRLHVNVIPSDLLQIHEGSKTEEGFRLNLRVGVQYIEAWLSGRGAVPIYHLMEDAATAEISRAQTWQWLKYGAVLESGIKVTRAFFEKAMHEEMLKVRQEVGARHFAQGRFAEAEKLFRELSVARDFVPFLTIPAYRILVAGDETYKPRKRKDPSATSE